MNAASKNSDMTVSQKSNVNVDVQLNNIEILIDEIIVNLILTCIEKIYKKI